MTIDALPAAPSTSDPANFAAEGDAFLAALALFVTQANALATAMNLNATTDTSASSVAVGTGAKSFTVSTGKSYQPGMWLVVADTAAPSTNQMYGTVTSYDTATGALVMNVVSILGSGTKTAWTISQSAPAPYNAALRGHISGLELSNNVTDATNDIDVASGSAVDTTNTYLMTLTGPFTKRLDAAWAVGTGNGGLDTGTIANAEYHVWLIRKDSDGSLDILFSLSATAPTMPTGYTAKRRIRSIFRASAAILLFIQKGDRVYYKTPPLDVDTTIGTTATSYTMSVPGGGIAILNVLATRTGNTMGVYVYSPEITDQAHSESVSPLSNFSSAVGGATTVISAGQIEVLTNSSSQIRAVSQLASTALKIATAGYIDNRGKDS